MIREGDIVLCTKRWEGNSLIKGQFGFVKKVVTLDNNKKFYWIEFFSYVNGHNRFGKDGHCWIVGEKAVTKVEEYKWPKEVARNLVFERDGL